MDHWTPKPICAGTQHPNLKMLYGADLLTPVNYPAPLAGRGFPTQQQPPLQMTCAPDEGLTLLPWAVALVPNANKRRPSSRILIAAFTSLSCLVLQLGHSQFRTFWGRLSTWLRHTWQVLLDGKNRPISRYVFPSFSALYFNCLVNSDQPQSLMAFARLWFFTMFLTARFSTMMTWFSFTNLRESLCWKSLRVLAMRSCTRATQSMIPPPSSTAKSFW